MKAQLELGESTLDADLKPRFKYVVHDFFTEQPIKGADAYLIRWCMHNWSDKYALQIIKSLVPALKNGSKVIINELTLPEPNTSNPWDERRIRYAKLIPTPSFQSRQLSNHAKRPTGKCQAACCTN